MRAFFSAIAFLTRIPVPVAWQSRRENAMFAAYPAAGLVMGCLLAAVYWAAGLLFPPAVTAVLCLGAMLLLTGALHVDGLADCADAFYGARDRETTLRILKDPRIGTMGGCAIAASLLARFAALISLPSAAAILCLPFAMMLSRTVVIGALAFLPYVRAEGGILSSKPPVRSAGLTAAGIVSVLFVGVLLPVPTAACLLACALFWRLSGRRIQGCTGDVLGASIEITEVVFLVVCAAAGAVHVGLLSPLAALRGIGL